MAFCSWLFKITVLILCIIAVALYVKINILTQPTKPCKLTEYTWWGKEPKKLDADTSLRPFKVDISLQVIEDMYRRLNNTRFVESLDNTEFQYGFHSQALKSIVKYWKEKYSWKETQKELNKYNHFLTNINGIDVHFVRAKPSKSYKKVKPLLLCHGWPGSFYEFYKIISMLTDPLKHGGSKDDLAFDVVVPSIPGYAFSEAPHKPGFNAMYAAQTFDILMQRLGHQRYFVQGGDWGSLIALNMAAFYPERVDGIHVNTMAVIPTPSYFLKVAIGSLFPSLVMDVRDEWKVYPFFEKLKLLWGEMGYFHLQTTKPDTVGVALADSPAGLAAYILEKFSTWTSMNNVNELGGGLKTLSMSMDELLTNVMIYWVTNSITSSMRFYKEYWLSNEQEQLFREYVWTVPAGYAVFPEELASLPESMARDKFPNLVSYTDMPRGGHFAAFEEPELLATDIRKFVRIVNSIWTPKNYEEITKKEL